MPAQSKTPKTAKLPGGKILNRPFAVLLEGKPVAAEPALSGAAQRYAWWPCMRED